jgi:magnesium transporter
MSTNVPLATMEQTLGDVQDMLQGSVSAHESINYIYVVDETRKLAGILSIKDLYRHTHTTKVSTVAKKDSIVTVKATTDQERVAYLALQHNIKAIPVVDHEHHFLGVIPSDTILTILYKETHEDLLRLSGVHHHKSMFDNVLTLSLWDSFKHRIPWLFVGLLGGLLAAKFIQLFEGTLEQNLVLTAFVPLVVYMSSAVGTQMGGFMIRDLAIVHQLPFAKYFYRQFLITLAMALCFSVLLFVVTSLFYGSVVLSVVLGVSLFVSIISSIFTGLVIPEFFSLLKMDPANASGPIATIIQDLLTIVIYFSVAALLL